MASIEEERDRFTKERDRFTKMFVTAVKEIDAVVDNIGKGQYIQAKAAALTVKKALDEMMKIVIA